MEPELDPCRVGLRARGEMGAVGVRMERRGGEDIGRVVDTGNTKEAKDCCTECFA